jgi:two-component sensor histidine kinase
MALNATLEERVRARTADVRAQRDRAEMLLKEVHHRVGNSLALVGALVRLQASVLSDPAAIDALKEAQTRINAIARLHKQLYTSEDVRVVAIGPFVASLVADLETTMRAEGSPHSVRVTTDDLLLATDKAVSVGVLVTELLTNAYKYAYPKGGAEEIRVIIQQEGEQARIVVEDDGVGWSGTGKPTGTGLGSQIVGAMATNLRADLSYDKLPGGTRVVLNFPI